MFGSPAFEGQRAHELEKVDEAASEGVTKGTRIKMDFLNRLGFIVATQFSTACGLFASALQGLEAFNLEIDGAQQGACISRESATAFAVLKKGARGGPRRPAT